MISILQWLSLLLFYSIYLSFGAMIFVYTESDYETQSLKELHKLQSRLSLVAGFIQDPEVKEELLSSLGSLEGYLGKNILLPKSYQRILQSHVLYLHRENNEENPDTLDDLMYRLERVSVSANGSSYELRPDDGPIDSIENVAEVLENKTNTNITNINNSSRFDVFWNKVEVKDSAISKSKTWTYMNAFYFAFVTITTIGFGQISPSTPSGQAFCLGFAIIGVALSGILVAGLAEIFASKILKRFDEKRYRDSKLIVLDTILYIIPGIVVFFFLPAIAFSIIEEWSYLSSLYFAFIALSTIGFGDLIAGYPEGNESWIWYYRVVIHLWIVFGLGYLFMIIGFIQKALKSNKIRSIDRKVSQILKQAGALPIRQKDVQNELRLSDCRLKSVVSIQDKDDYDIAQGTPYNTISSWNSLRKPSTDDRNFNFSSKYRVENGGNGGPLDILFVNLDKDEEKINSSYQRKGSLWSDLIRIPKNGTISGKNSLSPENSPNDPKRRPFPFTVSRVENNPTKVASPVETLGIIHEGYVNTEEEEPNKEIKFNPSKLFARSDKYEFT